MHRAAVPAGGVLAVNAVAVAAMRAAEGNVRRVVVLMLGRQREDGSRFDPTRHPYVFALPIRRPGEPEPEMRGSYSARGVMFNDPNEYVRSRKGTFVQQYDSRLDSLRLESDLIDHRDDFVQKYIKNFAAGRRTKYHVVWSVERSTSRRHPHWKKKTM